jgi:repressor LexA
MHDQPKLTARQQEILELIQKTIADTGAPPTRAEIAQVLGFKSANAAEEHLQALARKGAIDLVSGTSRGIRLKGSSRNSIRQSSDMFSLPLPGFAQLALPLIGRVAAGSPILAQEHVDRTYHVESHLFQEQPDYLLRVRGMSMRDAGIMMVICWRLKPPKKSAMVKLWWRALAMKSPSNACVVKQIALNFSLKTPTTLLFWLTQASPSISKA